VSDPSTSLSGRRATPLEQWVRFGLLWLIGANLRMALLALAPVLPAIHRDLSLDEAQIGLLSTLPVLLIGLAAVAGSAAVARLAPRRTIVACLVGIGVASGLRGVAPDTAALFGATLVMGLAIAVLQPALPTLVQTWFPGGVGTATAVYSNGMVLGEALAASLTLVLVVPLAGGWRGALALWGVPAVLAAVLLLALPGGRVPAPPDRDVPARWWPHWREGRTWRLGIFQGGASTLYFGTNAFLPTALHALGHPGLVTPCLAALNTTQIGATLVVGALARRGASVAPIAAIAGVGGLGGLFALLYGAGGVAIAGAALVGLCSAIGLVLSLALPALLAGGDEVHHVAAGMFTIGYVAAFVLPFLGGLAWDATGLPRAAFLPAAAGTAVSAVALLGRRSSTAARLG